VINWLRHILTGKDNETHDIARWSWVITTLTTISGAAWNAYHAGVIDLMSFAQAIGIITGAHGASIMMKKDTEPNVVNDSQLINK
jgi:hypothetical protein